MVFFWGFSPKTFFFIGKILDLIEVLPHESFLRLDRENEEEILSRDGKESFHLANARRANGQSREMCVMIIKMIPRYSSFLSMLYVLHSYFKILYLGEKKSY